MESEQDLQYSVFRRVRKDNFALSCHVCPSVRMEQLGFHCADFHEIFRNSVEKIKVSLKSDRNKQYFTRRRKYIYDISLIYALNENCFKKSCTENQNTYFMFKNFFLKIVLYEIMCNNIVKTQSADDNTVHALSMLGN